VLIGPNAPTRKFYLIATRRFGNGSEWTAIPVSGECELATSELLPRTAKLPAYVAGLLSFPNDIIEVLDLEKLIASCAVRSSSLEARA